MPHSSAAHRCNLRMGSLAHWPGVLSQSASSMIVFLSYSGRRLVATGEVEKAGCPITTKRGHCTSLRLSSDAFDTRLIGGAAFCRGTNCQHIGWK